MRGIRARLKHRDIEAKKNLIAWIIKQGENEATFIEQREEVLELLSRMKREHLEEVIVNFLVSKEECMEEYTE